jgi:hypothetical protein
MNGGEGGFPDGPGGKSDDLLTVSNPEQWLEANRLLGWGIARFSQNGRLVR